MWRWLVAASVMGCNGTKDGSPTGDTGTPDTQTEPTPSTGTERVATILGLTGDPTAGEATYTAICAACHAADGTGVAPNPALTDRIPTLTDDQVVTTILEGKGNMDAYDTLVNQEIADVAAYVITNFGPTM